MHKHSVVGRLLQITGILVVGLPAFACSSSSSGSGSDSPVADVASICTKLINCGAKDSKGQTIGQGDCENANQGWIPGSSCTSAITGATCGQVIDTYNGNPPSAIKSACFPDCSTSTCSSDQKTITACSTYGSSTYDCQGVCERDSSYTYSGICGTSYNGQTSEKAVCWCKKK